MNQLEKLFNYEGYQVRTVIKNEEPWFVVTDVCQVLALSNPTESLRALDEDEKSTLRISEGGPERNIINEAGLYTLIIRSNKTEAKQFKRWITHEVLPSIRKTGNYQKPQSIEDLIIMQATSVKELKAEVAILGQTVTTIQDTLLNRDEDWRKSINTMLNRSAFKLGGQYRDLRKKSYEILEERAHCNLNQRLRNMLDRLEQSGATKTTINNTSKLDVIENDVRLKEIYTTIVKELSIGSLKISS